MTESTSEKIPVLKGLDTESRQMIIDTVRQMRNRLFTREKILEYDKNEIFPEETIREVLGLTLGCSYFSYLNPTAGWAAVPETAAKSFLKCVKYASESEQVFLQSSWVPNLSL